MRRRDIHFIPWNYSAIKQNDSVVVLCAGPSITQYAEKIKQYIKDNNSITISANYDYGHLGIKTDYTYITDTFKLMELVHKIQTPLIVPDEMKTDRIYKNIVSRRMRLYKDSTKRLIRMHFSGPPNVFVAGSKTSGDTTYVSKGKPYNIRINEDGSFPYKRFGSAGQGAMILSLVFRPKKILVVGLDGPPLTDVTHKMMFNGKKVKYGDKGKFQDARNYIRRVLIPSIISKNVVIETYTQVLFYGIDKEKYGIKVLKENNENQNTQL